MGIPVSLREVRRGPGFRGDDKGTLEEGESVAHIWAGSQGKVLLSKFNIQLSDLNLPHEPHQTDNR